MLRDAFYTPHGLGTINQLLIAEDFQGLKPEFKLDPEVGQQMQVLKRGFCLLLLFQKKPGIWMMKEMQWLGGTEGLHLMKTMQ
jgi:hypothetical protein